MKKTTNFFVIDNFNTVPTELTEYCEDYIIYDSSTNSEVVEKLKESGLKYKTLKRTGNSISYHFQYFIDNYEKLPEVMCLVKGHMIGRHCSKEFFDRVYDNKYFTYLYEDKSAVHRMNPKMFFLTMENQYIELNNTWYICSKDNPHRYFVNVNDLLKFIYKDPLIPPYLTFAPGNCYIVRREQVLKHSPQFYERLNYISTYGLDPNYPIEAQMIERILPIIYESNYVVNDWMESSDNMEFISRLKEEEKKVIEYDKRKKNIIQKAIHKVKYFSANRDIL